MHIIQEKLADYETMNDSSLVETVVDGWEVVCLENEEHRNLVSSHQYAQWVSYRDGKSERLESIVESFEGELNESDKLFLTEMARDITRAQHKSADQILEEAVETKIEEGSTTATLSEKKVGWLKKIRQFFKK